MQRLTGIGVSPGVVAGRAVLLIQRAQVLRYQIAPARLEHELQRLDESRAPIARAAGRHPRAAARSARPELASLFDAQLLMLDDPMLVPRAAEIVREQRVNAEWAVQQVFARVQRGVRRGRRSVPARAQGRRRRSGRPAADEPAPGRRHAARSAARARRVVGADRRRADAVDRRAGGLDEGARLRDRRGQPHLSHRDPGAFARRAGGRRPAQRQRAGAGGAAGRHRRHRQRGDPRSDAGGARARRASRRRSPAGGDGRRRAAAAGGDRRRRAASASTPTSSSPTISPRPAMPARKGSGCTARSSS